MMDYKIQNLYKIKVLSEVCKTNSYLIASKNLHVSPSAVSKIIKSLEAEWNIKLVQSKGNSIKVTERAEQLARLSTNLLQANDDFNSHLNLLRGGNDISVLQIGSGGSHTKILMNRLLTFFQLSYPKLEYEVITNNSTEILERVEKGELDCGIVSGTVPEQIDKELIFEDNISLYAHRNHPLALASLALKDLNYPVCVRENGSATRLYVEEFLSSRQIQLPQIKQTGKNDELTEHLCQTQNALQFLSDFYYQNSHWNKDFVKIQCSEVVIPIPVYFITRSNFPFVKLKRLLRNGDFQEEILAS